MSTEIFKTFADQAQNFYAPVYKYNRLLTENLEQLSKVQLSAAKAYSELGLEQIKAVGDIKDPQSLVAFGNKQLELVNKISKQLLDDTQKLSSMNEQFKKELETLTKDQLSHLQVNAN
ncbi:MULTISPECIES: phasin family protein [Plesiomonas]|uniref:PHA granule-associated protein n=2 Tax=Plesiomonas shigelloides TaxID=703 RepID=R8ALY7_PLESH|nr:MULTISPECIES: phasin family protein [Plesiomonas]AVQ87978.1 phasin family protein [Plesiomonas shigelloides]EON87339.1 PHA granule-associated protein [Plesiomonas shigelloides 302-73]KAB7655783.1 phasin family protein [Plesiomonas shigelloides]KAB7666252.1 phasin family protein [Plesiomonas shigelloides]KAB7668249.1 phasin family protein [Plesiomonas shigelloides]